MDIPRFRPEGVSTTCYIYHHFISLDDADHYASKNLTKNKKKKIMKKEEQLYIY